MMTTRKQRQDFIKMMKKQNPYMSKQELATLKKEMTNLGKQQHELLQEQVKIDKSLDIVAERKKSKRVEVDIDSELEDIDNEDFAPEDL